MRIDYIELLTDELRDLIGSEPHGPINYRRDVVALPGGTFFRHVCTTARTSDGQMFYAATEERIEPCST